MQGPRETTTSEGEKSIPESSHPLRGTPVKFTDPTHPVADADWEASLSPLPLGPMRGFLRGMDTRIEREDDRL